MKKEERISFYTHFAGFIAAIIAMIILFAISEGVSLSILSLVYGLSVVFLFMSSSLYHAFKKEEKELSFWRKLDHFAIFVMIAGTYTPVSFIYLEGYWKWSIIILQWSLVLGGFFFKFFYLKAPRYLYTIIYLLMGWSGVIPIRHFFASMPLISVIYMLLGGLAFTVGAVFYMIKKPQKIAIAYHEIFHIFILIGWFFHYLLVFRAISS
ncbi:PAQR family membrane homeostasis protein TrhA [Natronospora cellulosivora (SeqCode)]